MRIWRYKITNITNEHNQGKKIELEITHKYWYIWQIFISFFWFHLVIEILRTDWNKCYKDQCKNYEESKCKHCIDCPKLPCYDDKIK